MPNDITRTPPDIAREALRQLALKRVAPTPDNYRAYYHQIAGTACDDPFPERMLRLIANALPRETPEALRLARGFESAVTSRQWPAVRQAVLALAHRAEPATTNWAHLFRDVIALASDDAKGWPATRKREALEQALAGTPSATVLHARLQGLIKQWSAAPAQADLPRAPADASGQALALPAGIDPSPVAGLLGHLLLVGAGSMLTEAPEVLAELKALTDELATGTALTTRPDLEARTRRLAHRLELVAEDQRGIRQALLGLLKLIVTNIGELVSDDSWLSGQISLINSAFGNDLDLRVLDEIERRLRDVIDKQGHLKRQLVDVQQRLKEMLAGLVDQLAEFSGSTDQYHASLERCATQIAGAETLAEVATIIEGIMIETRSVSDTARRSGDQLKNLRDQVETANVQIARLQRELDETSEMVRHDVLTGTLNRKGIDDALEREISRMRRSGAPICITMLDIDNFKQLNDTFGHRTGDEALKHLAEIIRSFTRPHDTVGRYGGEEFIILLPDTEPDAANEVITRLQRELTKRFFLADNQRVLITFSAGIARIDPDEDPYAAIDRADKAMYAAKRAGKNRVLLAA